MSGWQPLLPWIAVATIPGVLNVSVASEELFKKSNLDPLSTPYKNPGFWLWAIVEFSLPLALCWWQLSLGTQPSITWELIFKALLAGLQFPALLNADLKIGGVLPITLKSFHDFLLDRIYTLFNRDRRQGDRNSEFWRDVEYSLRDTSIFNSSSGLIYLEDQFERMERYESRKLAISKYKDDLANARKPETTQSERAKLIKKLLREICQLQGRETLFRTLQSFHLKDELWVKYQKEIPQNFSQLRLKAGRDR
ncbi:MAG: hypothetical protein LH679_02575 [Cyanobacteria bacterium CAN_BIN43]|nr:hypothetical protein [Cyanobacteria bacterium CAN_BIN43]